ncbi:MAG: MBL fold metallo-hydrolase [Clostridiales bacterium]|nr:MBL fold metallo-hydrolase [Clostridiales bacterium]
MNDNTKKALMRLLAILIVFIISYVYNRFFMKENLNNSKKVNLKDNINNSKFADVDLNNEDFNILFMYVGQADSTLIKYKNKIMLIDAGNNEDGKNIVKFLKDKGISKLDYIVGTHYDEDHIGGLDDIIENFDIGKFYLSNGGELGPNYYNLEKAAKKKNLAITIPKVGDKIDFGDVDMEVMSASKFDGKNDNNASIVIQAKYGSRKYLFMGDLEKQEEAKRKWNEVDVLKAGHHGSNTSSTQEFLNQVKPKYVFVSAGKNNKYRLPNVKAMERIEKMGAKIFRTDVNESSFWLTSNGNDIDIKEVSINLDGNGGK